MNSGQIEQSNWSEKSVFSTGEAAQVCNVSQQTIIRCFDSGRLQGFRVPGSKFRRIPRDELIRFMRANDIPLARIEGRRRRVLCVVSEGSLLERLADESRPQDRLDIAVVRNGFDAGWAARESHPSLVLIDRTVAPAIRAAIVSRYARMKSSRPFLVLVGARDEDAELRVDLRIDEEESASAIEQRLVQLLDDAEATGLG